MFEMSSEINNCHLQEQINPSHFSIFCLKLASQMDRHFKAFVSYDVLSLNLISSYFL